MNTTSTPQTSTTSTTSPTPQQRVAITSSTISPITPRDQLTKPLTPIKPLPLSRKRKAEESYKEMMVGDESQFFANKDNHIKYMKWLASMLGYRYQEHWYKCRRVDFASNHGKLLLAQYGDDHIKAITTIYADQKWELWRFPTIRKGFWTQEMQREYMEWLGKRLDWDKEQWHFLTKRDFARNSGSQLLEMHDGSISNALTSIFPEYSWKPWMFDKVPEDYWIHKGNARLYLEWLADRLKLVSAQDWYDLTQRSFGANYGFKLLQAYNKSPWKLITTVMPELHSWESWRFRVLKGKRTNILILEELINKLSELHGGRDQLANVSLEAIEDIGGKDMLDEFGGSIASAMEALTNKDKYLNPEPKTKKSSAAASSKRGDDDDDDLDLDDISFEDLNSFESDMSGGIRL
ncbi:hypothetical protein SAMD00019534_084960 [Acytostelium subglobosum LB1]|uniref:hypothetical protein n=1 Tax=Acytostelium subglobosum LB1 TaxID=1410327 RepID=UPI000644EED2|nr:hypothetical protein SAMD00019534_084960 [Acytostelium subglobosum LB1]GAM25321.1 hypothetical protein SAMD00019534_084960 [Acytostelium subglobosum LB1]|eukprot:XP_012751841.1 hypothetical protein SAMD00019534_084960 [Acytostelium subglobosum LB1]